MNTRNLLLSLTRPVQTLFLAALVCSQAHTAPAAEDAFAANRRLGRGVNVLGYDPIWKSFDQARFKVEYFRMLREAGFDSIRFNLHPFRHMGAAPDYPLTEAWWSTARWAMTNALAAKLTVILDFHEFNSLGRDPEGNKAKFLAFWRQVAPQFKDAPANVVFEILNEPSQKLTPELWNQYLAEALASLRQSNPTRTVIVGPAFWNSVDHLDELVLPEADRNLIVTVHYYKPMEFTHQGAGWTDYRDKLGVAWEGTSEQQAALTRDFEKVQAWAQKHQRPIFLGEFGAYDKGEMASRARYTAFVTRTAERLGWSWAYWQFDSDFVLYDLGKGQWVEPILKALVPAAKPGQP